MKICARAYVEAGIAHLTPPPPVLAAVGGLSGSGKSTFARAIASGLGASPGAVILRTDEVRKRLWGVAPTARLGPDAYTAEAHRRTHDELFANARDLLAAGVSVVLDATFLDGAERSRAAQVAAAAGVPFCPAWLDAPLAVLEARITARSGDASDATIAVLRDQAERTAGVVDWPYVDAEGPAADAVRTWQTSVI